MRKSVLVSILCVSVMMLWVGNALAFHDGGVAYCGGCHTMHNSQNGAPIAPNGPYNNLLKMATPSDVCLSCHTQSSSTSQSGRAVLSLDPLNPNYEMGGGDFVFLTEDNIYDGHGSTVMPGNHSGHNVIAPSKNLAVEPDMASAPGSGGAYLSSWLGCTGCHDPHGNEFFRLLNTTGPIQDGLFQFTAPAPDAIGVALGSGAQPESQTNHTAYNGGMSAWCGNCHGDFHNASNENFHPSGEAINGLAGIYNEYNGTGDQTGGLPATAYLPAVPFEDPSMTVSSTAGPSGDSEVSCITCHRSHATSGPDAGRWDFLVTVLEEDGVASGSYAIPNPYQAQTAEQRSLCNKCHNKDEGDELNP